MRSSPLSVGTIAFSQLGSSNWISQEESIRKHLSPLGPERTRCFLALDGHSFRARGLGSV
jgi:hypothetical protein